MSLLMYLDIQLLFATINLLIGLYMTCSRIPQNMKSSYFDQSRKLMGCAIIINPLTAVLFYFTDLKHLPGMTITAIHLVSYYIMTTLFATAFIQLLECNKKELKKKITRDIATCLVIFMVMGGALISNNDKLIDYTTLAAALVLLVRVIYISIDILILYRKTIKKAQNYYVDEIEVKISWIIKSLYLLIALGIVGCFAAFSPFYSKWIGIIIIFFELYAFAYVLFCYVQFILDFKKLTKIKQLTVVVPEIPTAKVQLNTITQQTIENNLGKWIENKGYTQKSITIQTLSMEVCTNRTYLSAYINKKYDCSFKAWVTKLRIEDAKKMLCAKQEYTATEIANTVGFLSLTSFTHVFKKNEGISPIKWKMQNKIPTTPRSKSDKQSEHPKQSNEQEN